MLEFDLTRIAFAFFCGYFLSLSGSLTQVVTNNNLASPSTLGFDGLAALCVIIASNILVFFPTSAPLEYLSFSLFISLFVLLGWWLWRDKRRTPRIFSLDIKFLVLMGLAFNLFVGAIFSVIQFLFMALNTDFPSGLWFGSFRYYHEESLILFSLLFLLLQFALAKYASQLRLLGLGESVALGLGVNVKQTQKAGLLCSFFLTGLVISFFGVFSFLSLIIPHMLRMLPVFKRNVKRELRLGALVGGVALALLDTLCFNFDYMGAEFPAGMVSSVVGAFSLIALLLNSQLKNFAKD